jgi:hypothetical protein
MPNYRLSEYDRKRQEELNSANVPLFWIVFALLVFTGPFLLIRFLDWVG